MLSQVLGLPSQGERQLRPGSNGRRPPCVHPFWVLFSTTCWAAPSSLGRKVTALRSPGLAPCRGSLGSCVLSPSPSCSPGALKATWAAGPGSWGCTLTLTPCRYQHYHPKMQLTLPERLREAAVCVRAHVCAARASSRTAEDPAGTWPPVPSPASGPPQASPLSSCPPLAPPGAGFPGPRRRDEMKGSSLGAGAP